VTGRLSKVKRKYEYAERKQKTIEEATLKHIWFLVSKVKVLCIVHRLISGYVT